VITIRAFIDASFGCAFLVKRRPSDRVNASTTIASSQPMEQPIVAAAADSGSRDVGRGVD
jgi:hypothetical protein